MKWVLLVQAQKTESGSAGPVLATSPPLPAAKDIPLDLALDAMSAHGIMIKAMTQQTSYTFDGLEFDLSMTILVHPKEGKETLDQLNSWYFGKAFKKWP